MKKLKYLLLKIFGRKQIVSNTSKNRKMGNKTFYDLSMRSLDGKEISFSQYKGKKLLLVNTASECGYTPQYAELQELHETKGDRLTILGFPANNFGGQEPGSNPDIAAFCSKNFGVGFQLFEKSDVVGKDQNPVYRWLTDKQQNGWNEEQPSWNFCKYLVNENGELVRFYSAAVSPLSDEILDQIDKG